MSEADRTLPVPSQTTDRPRASVVWLVRHAETAAPTMFHGAESDIELGEHGHRQASAAIEWFAALKPTAIVSSEMLRAKQTAAPIASALGVPHLFEPHLHERRVGPLTRKPRAEADHIWDETTRHWVSGNTAYSFPGMESFDELRDRTLPAFNRVVSAHPGGRVVIVCHGVVCKVLLLSLLRGYGPANWNTIGRVVNLAVSELVPDDDLWAARQILVVPPQVAAVNAAFEEVGVKKTEA
ncbi:phosphoglycerate mutase : Fructose-2,6-bisphosphatase OS=Singulisphaera acidiphila (strain ATCC BAA-1392 / DSM 18658 / VKM B-2454 / MOB10) GN=Sinac_1498 PE=4 SV=1: His_Phos_1 [Gemmata massiliana]|uniref:Histidine phosphatase family protein n=1 Tax=Gemmata massiliana TaxID=1210884 RepID=A0A6P2CZH9_9BACT|nr:histidine phosphatase family protein [Gemmata massiliana]VTR93535.1 phosphoglycerate mutase : Fructose-2,6-bisphosphatase OS=Singulisphaera acidiphila (strain ATCC BAA-1392 / DSM 18658 / VKM B-2454 / MOB10) GN=Sinac_1498 PE=4 SV=1: His_Phos_1 [Gemmata massiliana]